MKRRPGILRSLAFLGCILPALCTAAEDAAGEIEPPIAAVQAFLRQERLYSGPVDGAPSRATDAAVRRYQILHGLRATGRLDAVTLRRMLATPPPPPDKELTASDQELLRDLAQTPLPEPVAERRVPIPAADPPPPVAGKPSPENAKKPASRTKTGKTRKSGPRTGD